MKIINLILIQDWIVRLPRPPSRFRQGYSVETVWLAIDPASKIIPVREVNLQQYPIPQFPGN
jgi:hypothetical protein